jgi:hypothetical protein
MEQRTLTFNELMVIGAIQGGHLNPYQPQTWDKDPAFYRGLARLAAIILKAKEGFKTADSEQFEFWQKDNELEACKQKIQETIKLLQAKKLLGVAQSD